MMGTLAWVYASFDKVNPVERTSTPVGEGNSKRESNDTKTIHEDVELERNWTRCFMGRERHGVRNEAN